MGRNQPKQSEAVKLQEILSYIGFVFVLVAGCTMNPSQSDYLKTTEEGIKTVPHVQEIRQIFSNAPMSHFIEQLGLRIGETKRRPAHWNTVVWFGGRYELTYQTLVVPDYGAHSVKQSQNLIFVLSEVMKVTGDGRGAEFDPAGARRFGEEQWNKVVAAKGDFAVIGVHLKTNASVPGIEKYISAWKDNTWAIQE